MNHTILLFLADGFAETKCVYFIEKLRDAGLKVKVVSRYKRWIKGAHGIILSPDWKLDAISPQEKLAGFIFPSSRQCLSELFIDPRLTRLLDRTKTQQLPIVILGNDHGQRPELLKTENKLILQDNRSLDDYSEFMIDLFSTIH